MDLTPDAIGVIIALAGTVVTMLGGMGALFAWAWGRLDKRFEQVDKRLEQVDKRFEQVGARFDRVDAELADIRGDIVQLQVAVARLEGPHRSLALR